MKQFKFPAFLFFCLLAFAQNASAQATLSIQGVVKKSDGKAVDDGTYSVTFALYATETGGTAVWSETQPDLELTGGIYSALLGSVNPLTAAFNQTYYLGVKIGSGAELSPRARLTSSPYALSLIGQSNVFPSSGAIGAGTASPDAAYKLHVKSKALVESETGSAHLFLKGNSSDLGSIGFGTGATDMSISPGGSNAVSFPSAIKLTGNRTVTGDGEMSFNSTGNTLFKHGGDTKFQVTTNGAEAPGDLKVGNELQATNVVGAANDLFLRPKTGTNGKVRLYNASGEGVLEAASDRLYAYKPIEIGGSGQLVGSGNNFYFWANDDYGDATTTGNEFWSLICSARIKASEFDAFSDRRIKKDLKLSDGARDLATLGQLRVTDYRHVDEVQKGKGFKKGFIAQEVEQVFPEAVSRSTGVVPDIYSKAAQLSLQEGQLTVLMDKAHGLKIGDEVQLMGEKEVFNLNVVAIGSEKSFTVSDWKAANAPEWLFVYGKKVDDFRTVDYDRIHTLNVGATQELARQVEALKKENAELKARDGEMKTSLERLEGRLKKIEASLAN